MATREEEGWCGTATRKDEGRLGDTTQQPTTREEAVWHDDRERMRNNTTTEEDGAVACVIHCQRCLQWQLLTEIAAAMDAGDRIALTVFKIKICST